MRALEHLLRHVRRFRAAALALALRVVATDGDFLTAILVVCQDEDGELSDVRKIRDAHPGLVSQPHLHGFPGHFLCSYKSFTYQLLRLNLLPAPRVMTR